MRGERRQYVTLIVNDGLSGELFGLSGLRLWRLCLEKRHRPFWTSGCCQLTAHGAALQPPLRLICGRAFCLDDPEVVWPWKQCRRILIWRTQKWKATGHTVVLDDYSWWVIDSKGYLPFNFFYFYFLPPNPWAGEKSSLQQLKDNFKVECNFFFFPL